MLVQIVVEEFLEDINNILNSGEVPNLFEADEFERNIIECRAAAKDAGIAEGNRDAIYDFFINRVRSVARLQSLPPPLSPSSAVILNHISSHFLIPLSDSSLICIRCPRSDSSFWTL